MPTISATSCGRGNAEGLGTLAANQPEKLVKIGTEVVSHEHYVTFQMAELGVSRQSFAEILLLIARILAIPATA
jgi:hypothetical protein